MKFRFLALASLLFSFSISAVHLQIEIEDVLDLGYYTNAATILIPVDDVETAINYKVEQWNSFFHQKDYMIKIEGMVKKISEDGKQYFIDLKKDLYYKGDFISSLLLKRYYFLEAGRSVVTPVDAYWAPGLKLIVRQRNVMKIVD